MSEPKNPRGASAGPGAPRRRRSAEVARREILDAAQRRLSEGGPDAIRLQEIARDVGISHPTILHHFGSRDGLIGALDSRAIRALTEDVADILRADEAGSLGVELVERVAETMDQQGLARLIAWWAMRGAAETEGVDELDPAALVHDVSKLIDKRISAVDDSGADRLEEISFGVRLAVVAMLGDALVGDNMSQVGPEHRDAERHRFRAWLAQLLLKRLGPEPPDQS